MLIYSLVDEAELLQDEPEPETNNKTKAKDDLNAFALVDSEEEEEVEEGLTSAGKELKEILKREEGEEDSSLDEEDDIDADEKYSKSALFMQGTTNSILHHAMKCNLMQRNLMWCYMCHAMQV